MVLLISWGSETILIPDKGLLGVRFAEGGTRKAMLVKQEKCVKASKADGLSSRWHQH